MKLFRNADPETGSGLVVGGAGGGGGEKGMGSEYQRIRDLFGGRQKCSGGRWSHNFVTVLKTTDLHSLKR